MTIMGHESIANGLGQKSDDMPAWHLMVGSILPESSRLFAHSIMTRVRP